MPISSFLFGKDDFWILFLDKRAYLYYRFAMAGNDNFFSRLFYIPKVLEHFGL